MKNTNLLLYLGIILVIVGIVMAFFTETGRSQLIAGISTTLGLIISILGWVFCHKTTPSF
ncbi:hypothetical protein [Rhodohalobacter sp. 614A]|uniref:hypothetical protein n=1 Tax=Rhodohalobacter sp. 614A TaxID=2908649 RepID=UPI001F2DB7C5|nr:hypothetical protein [Rhodohalobacter sp. 614A]